ncbi:hypothetical protein PJ985_19350 [Streptomyces sp. ACA25]|uniref:hypothetical protein n=1 Tax=Streptomyces sp. ACA25 TaxID=3022596 RepID=UPI00230716F1|nr:hypothetical protein [Streptomyces sp. ACA25]MDB1089716.1 hypothetical protein [Streptomyces sp. ACA25]
MPRESWVLRDEQVDGLSLPAGDDGVPLGVDTEGRPALLPVHHPVPYDILLIGSLWTAQLLALRTVAAGLRVAVETGRPQAWARPVHAVGGGRDRLVLHEVGRVPPLGPAPGSPVLVVRDCGMRPPRGRTAAASWQPVLTLLPYLSPVAPGLMERAALVGVQRVSPEEGRRAGSVMGLPGPLVEGLSVLADDVTLWCTPRAHRMVRMLAGEGETAVLGRASRLDPVG